MSRRNSSTELTADDPRHGTVNAYNNLGCRCDRCRAANTEYCRMLRLRPPAPPKPAVPTQLPGEKWLPVREYVGLYEVSNLGRVRSLDRYRPHWRGNGTVLMPGKMLTPTKAHRTGHLQVTLSRDGHAKCPYVHVLVLEAFVSPRPDGLECCHYNGIANDNRVENLRWDTRSANRYDSVRHGTHPRGGSRRLDRMAASA